MPTALLDEMKGKGEPTPAPIDVDKLLFHMKAIPSRVQQTWKDVIQVAVRENRCEELHAAREEVKAYVDEQVAIMEWAVSGKLLAGSGHQLGRLIELEPDLTKLKEFRQDLFSQWQSIDDLYELAVRGFRYSEEKFKAYAAAHPIPQSWYDGNRMICFPRRKSSRCRGFHGDGSF